MTQLGTPGLGSTRSPGENDIYTALMAIAFLFVLTAVVFVGAKALALFGTLLPPGGS